MKKSITEYMSKNGIRFHHILSTFNPGEEESLAAESHYMCEMFLLLSGHVEYSIEGRTYKLYPGDVLTIPQNKIHAITFNTVAPCDRMSLLFSPSLLPQFNDIDLLSPFNATPYSHIISAELVKKTNLVELFHQIERICSKKGKFTDLHLLGYILKIVETLIELNKTMSAENNEKAISPVKTHEISYSCTQYVNSHLNENLNTEKIADALHISSSHLRQAFKKELGITLHHYIYNQKMQLARHLLTQGENPIEVASQLGYEYYSTFYHNYVKRFNIPPKAIRQKLSKDPEKD